MRNALFVGSFRKFLDFCEWDIHDFERDTTLQLVVFFKKLGKGLACSSSFLFNFSYYEKKRYDAVTINELFFMNS